MTDYHQGVFIVFLCMALQARARVIHPTDTIRNEDTSGNMWGCGPGQGVSLDVERRERNRSCYWLVLPSPTGDFLRPGTDPLALTMHQLIFAHTSPLPHSGAHSTPEQLCFLSSPLFLPCYRPCRTFNITSEGCCVCSE